MSETTPDRPKDWIDIGADVVDSGGSVVGKVAYVVVQPEDLHMTDIVVNTGRWLGRDIVVPANSIQEIRDGHIYLAIDKNGVEKFPDYVEVHYQQPPIDLEGVPSVYFPAQAVLWPTGTFYPQPTAITVNAPAGTVGLHKGMDVVSRDGHKVGAIESLDEDASTGDICDLIVKQGILFPHDTVVPADLIERIENDQVLLKLTRDQIQQRLEDKAATGLRTL